MKHKSFLFLIAALAMGLALFGCSTDSDDGGSTIYDYRGYASDVEAIEAAFDFADNVYLTKAVNVLGNEILVIKSGNHLHLKTFTVTVQDGGGIVTQDADGIAWDTGNITGVGDGAAYLIGPTGAFADKAVTKLAQLAITADDAANVVYTEVSGRAIGATTDPSKAFGADSAAKAIGGTLTVLITDEFTVPATHYSNAGSLAVTGNVKLAGTLAGAGGLDVYGDLTSSVDDTEKPTLVANALTVRKITTSGGDFGGAVTIKSTNDTSKFGGTQTTFTGVFKANGPVEFTSSDATFTAGGTLSAATFGGDVTFTADSTISGNAAFASGKKVTGKVAVTGQVSAGATGTNTLLLAPDGHIIYTGGVQNSFLSGVGTLAALGGDIGTLSFSIAANELAVSGAGSFVVNKAISLTGENKIKVDGTTGVYFAKTDGKIDAETYTLGGAVGTLSGGFILSADGIKGTESAAADDRPTVGYVVANTAGNIILTVNAGSTVALSNINLGVSAGTIAFGGTSNLHLDTGGSLTAAGGSLAHGGYIVTASNGSIAAGKVGSDDAEAVAAGSVGTTGNAVMYLSQNNYFFNSAGSATATVLETAVTAPVAVTAGSITVFADIE